jgi:hypothetical protein
MINKYILISRMYTKNLNTEENKQNPTKYWIFGQTALLQKMMEQKSKQWSLENGKHSEAETW